MNIVQRTSPNRNLGRQGWVPDVMVCHITEGAFDGAVSWLTNAASQASAHFVVARDGRVTQLVALENTAWANGTSGTPSQARWHGHATLDAVRARNVNANLYTISIEHEGFWGQGQGALAPAQLAATVALVRHIRAEVRRLYGTDIPLTRQHLVGHHEITPRTRPHCPGAQFPFEAVLAQVQSLTQAQEGAAAPAHAPSEWAREAWEWARRAGFTEGTDPQAPLTREQGVALVYRYHQQFSRYTNSS